MAAASKVEQEQEEKLMVQCNFLCLSLSWLHLLQQGRHHAWLLSPQLPVLVVGLPDRFLSHSWWPFSVLWLAANKPKCAGVQYGL